MIKITHIEYHRNGVGGEGFFAIEFSEGTRQPLMIATMTVDNDEHPEAFNGSCRVLALGNVREHWRGDYYESLLRPLFAKWYAEYYGSKESGQ